jgi:hypothetical protein
MKKNISQTGSGCIPHYRFRDMTHEAKIPFQESVDNKDREKKSIEVNNSQSRW